MTLAVEIDMASGREEGKPRLELLAKRTAPAINDRSQAPIESELPVLLADEINHSEIRLAFRTTKTAAQLLCEHGRAIGRSQQ
jgi:hypothetical protein